VTNTILWDNTGTSKKLIINGNNNVISGKNKYSFINVTSKNILELNNIILKNFKTAINSYSGKISLSNCTLTDNTGSVLWYEGGRDLIGAAIYSRVSNITATNCNFVNSNKDEGGWIDSAGAISSDYNCNVTLVNCTLANNSATNGGAIYADAYNNVTLVNCSLANNSATNGGAIYSNNAALICTNTVMMDNHANYRGGAIFYNNTKALNEKGLKFFNNSAKESDNIHYYVYKSKIELNDTVGIYHDTISITEKLLDNDNRGIRSHYLTYDIGGIKGGVYTKSYGIFNITLKVNETGIKNVYVEYNGSDYPPSNITKKLTVLKRNTTISLEQLTISEGIVTVKGKLRDYTNTKLGNANVYVSLNNIKQHLLTDTNGTFTTNFTITKTGQNVLSLVYNGNRNYEASNFTTSFQVTNKTTTNIIINPIKAVPKDSTVTITGKYTDINGNNLRYTPILITINGQTYKNSTDANGIYMYSYKTTTIGTNNVSVSYPGNSRYTGATAKTTFQVIGKIATKFTVNSVGTVQKGSVVTITGKYTDINGNNLRYTPIIITINGQTFTNSTDANGIYTYAYKTTTSGTNNVTVSYPGNSRYTGATAKTTFQVK